VHAKIGELMVECDFSYRARRLAPMAYGFVPGRDPRCGEPQSAVVLGLELKAEDSCIATDGKGLWIGFFQAIKKPWASGAFGVRPRLVSMGAQGSRTKSKS
jgi:hypothetical protein